MIIPSAEDRDAEDVRDQLVEAGIDAELMVCVRTDQADDARRILEGMQGDADPSAELDLETVAVFQGADAEMQAAAVQGLLEQSGISVVVEGAYGLPSLPFEIRVAGKLAGSARAILAQAEAEGPAAADAQAEGS
ncbi:MAG: putative signal transducing protein [Bryobacteraceae bacterium]